MIGLMSMDSPSEPINDDLDEPLSPSNDELEDDPQSMSTTSSSRHQDKKRPREHRKSYTCSFKLKVVEHAEKFSNSKAADEFDVHRRRVQEWKNQKDRLYEQVMNYNGSTKRLKGGGRKLRQTDESSPKPNKRDKKQKPTSDVEIETYLTKHLLDYTRKTNRQLTTDVVLKEAKKMNPKFKAEKEWAELFLEEFLVNQPSPLKKRLDSPPQLAPQPQTRDKRQRRRFYNNSTGKHRQVYRVGYSSPSPPLLSHRHYRHDTRHHHDDKYMTDERPFYDYHREKSNRHYDDIFYQRHHCNDNEHRDKFLEKVEKDENNLVYHLEKWLQSFVDNYHATDPIDVNTLRKLAMQEAQKNAVVFTVTSEWVQEFLELNASIYMSKCSMKPMSTTRYYCEDVYEISESYDDKSDVEFDVPKGNLVMAALRDKSFGIHEWMDKCKTETD